MARNRSTDYITQTWVPHMKQGVHEGQPIEHLPIDVLAHVAVLPNTDFADRMIIDSAIAWRLTYAQALCGRRDH